MKSAGTALLKRSPGSAAWTGLSLLSAVLALTGFFTFLSSAPLLAGLVKPGRFLPKALFAGLLFVLLFLLDRGIGILFAFVALFPAALLYPYMKEKMDMRDMFLTLAGYAFLLAGVVWSLKTFGGWDLPGLMLVRFNEALDTALVRWPGRMTEVDFSLARDMVSSVLIKFYPAAIFLGVMILAAMNATLSLVFLRDGYSPRRIREDFSGWETDFRVMGLLLGLWAGVLAGLILKNESVRVFCLNGLLMAAFFYFLQGLAVVTAGLRKIPGPGLIKFFLLFLLLQLVPLLVTVTAVFGFGLMDEWFHFRRITIPSGGDS